MFTFIIVLVAILAVLLTVIILLQSGKGGGLAGIAAGGSTQQVLGARQAPDILEKATWTLGTIFLVLCLVSNFAIDRGEQQESVIQERAGQQQSPTPEGPILPPATGNDQSPTQPNRPTPDGNQQQAPGGNQPTPQE